MDANTVQTAFSSADYRVLLPLGKHVQVLVIDTREYGFLPQLVDSVKSIDVLVNNSNEAYWLNVLKTLELPNTHPIKSVTKDYDLVFSDGLQQLSVRKGGTLCRFFKQRSAVSEKTPLRRYGVWFAWPDWPTLRVLIPDSRQGIQAAVRRFPIYSNPALSHVVSRWLPSWVTARIGNHGIILYRHGDNPIYPSFWAQLVEALSVRPELGFLKTVPAEQQLIGPEIARNSHIVITLLDKNGSAQGMIKCARFPQQSLLLAEKRSETIVNLLGSELAEKLTMPTAMITLDGRVVSAYHFRSDWVMAGSQWRLRNCHNLLWAMTHWLVKAAYKTAHPLPVSQFWEKHGLPLEHLQGQKVLPEPFKKTADEALVSLEKASFRAFSVLEHGHLDIHNIQITSKNSHDFRIDNWESVDLDGAPLVDLCYLLASCNAPPELAAQCMGAYLHQTGYPTAMALPLWFSYVARRWQWDSTSKTSANGEDLLRMTALVHAYVQMLEHTAV
jgi:hypothetical protein